LANPILSARSCKPNFQGNPITIYQTIPGSSDVYEWTPVNANGGHITLVQEWEWHAFESGEFLIPFTGQPDSSYNFKYAITSSPAFRNSHCIDYFLFLLLGWLLILPVPYNWLALLVAISHLLPSRFPERSSISQSSRNASADFTRNCYSTQNFRIECSSCSSDSVDVGIGCVISHPSTTTCVTGNTGGATLDLAPCDGTSTQIYNFRRA
jgi:hypothetical protein